MSTRVTDERLRTVLFGVGGYSHDKTMSITRELIEARAVARQHESRLPTHTDACTICKYARSLPKEEKAEASLRDEARAFVSVAVAAAKMPAIAASEIVDVAAKRFADAILREVKK